MAKKELLTHCLVGVIATSFLVVLAAQNENESSSTDEFNVLSFLQGIGVVMVVAMALFTISSRILGPKAPEGMKLPPSYSVGMPFVGTFLEFGKNPMKFVQNATKKVGGCFTLNFPGERCTFLVGAKYQQSFFEASDEELEQAPVYSFMTPIFGKGVVYDAPMNKRREQIRALGSCLKPSLLKKYPPVIAKEAFEYFKSHFGEEGQVDLLPKMAELIILTASATLMGPEVRHNLFKEVSHLFESLDKGLTPLSVFWPNAPIAAHRKRDAARKKMVELFSRVLQKRRENKGASNQRSSKSGTTDMLHKLLEFEYKDGTKLSDDEITGLLIATLFAGQHTSSITSTWSILFLLENKRKNGEIFNRVLNEIQTQEKQTNDPGCFARGEKIDWNVLSNESNLYNCIKESIRMFPPLIMLMRRVQKAFTTFDGFYVPKGDRIFVSNAVSQRLDEVFETPNEWKPDRWNEFNITKLPKYSFIGFGAGIHTCMGESFAFLQIQTILTVLFSMYDLDLVTPFPGADYAAIVVPPGGPNMVKYKLKKDVDFSKIAQQVSSMISSEPQQTSSSNVEDNDDENSKYYSLEEIAKHNSKHDAWLVVKNKVYDVSNYVHLHQGGDNAILKHAGKPDATDAVFGPQHPKTVKTLLERFYIGNVKQA